MKARRWQNAKVSPDGTHHVCGGRPLYAKRFLRVLPFHAPGLAAAQDRRGGMHIDAGGNPSYPHVFTDVFGFYENRAAVRSGEKWFHIKTSGAPAYGGVYHWCGNFQNGMSVVRDSGGYFHIRPDGRALYSNRFLYAGDFRERRAVVRLECGLCAHIDEKGGYAHSFRYRDLDVYHKGYARARDGGGWLHVDKKGRPAYEERFASVEPFYNGRSLAETRGGDIVVIDETGKTANTVMRASQTEKSGAFHALSADMAGYWKTYALYAAAKINFASKCPIPAETPEKILGISRENARVFTEAMAELDVVRLREGMWELTGKGELMHPDSSMSLFSAAIAWGEFAGADKWFFALHSGPSSDCFAEAAKSADKVKIMHGMLAAYAAHDYAALPDLLPLDGARKLIDAGGGAGVAARLIAARRKNIKVIVLDRPEVLALLDDSPKHGGRVDMHACDMFSPWGIGGDAVLLARVLHDWDDARALSVLRHARAALPPGGKVFVVESIKRGGDLRGLLSLHLLAVGGGRERTEREYRILMETAGIQTTGIRELASGVSLIIGETL